MSRRPSRNACGPSCTSARSKAYSEKFTRRDIYRSSSRSSRRARMYVIEIWCHFVSFREVFSLDACDASVSIWSRYHQSGLSELFFGLTVGRRVSVRARVCTDLPLEGKGTSLRAMVGVFPRRYVDRLSACRRLVCMPFDRWRNGWKRFLFSRKTNSN